MAFVRPHFSLRALLIMVTLAVAFLAWRDRSRQLASRFTLYFGHVAGIKQGLQLCGLPADIDRWTIRDVRVGEFKQSPGMAGWLLDQRVATFKICVYDREVGYGNTDGIITASPWGIEPHLYGNWQSELPPLLQWFLE
jgi:hypothetical protein